MKFEFEHIEYLTALAIIPALLFILTWVIRQKRQIAKQIGNPALVKQLTADHSPFNFFFKFCLILVALAAIIMGVVNMQKPGASVNVKRAGVDVVIALDVSKSMLADDIKPNRLEMARQLIYKLLDQLKDDRIGLVLFAGRSYLQMPLTTDHSAARIYVQNASPEVVPTQGTVVAEALKMSNSAFNSKERKYKSIILITDGEDHDAEALTLGASLAANGIMVNSVGIGSIEGAPIMDPATDSYKKDPQGQTVISRLNEELLKNLATTTNGVYLHLENIGDAVSKITAQLDTIEKSPIEDSAFRDYDTYYYWFLGLALLFLIIELLWPERKWKKVTVGTAILLFSFFTPAHAQPENNAINSGNKFYKDGKFDKAVESYQQALTQNPDNAIARYNLAAAQFRLNKFDEAEKTYAGATEKTGDNTLKHKATYNNGVSLTKQKKLIESITSYKSALKMDPADADTRFNLQKALEELHKQQKDSQPKQQPPQQQKKEQKKEQQQQPPATKKQIEQWMQSLRQKEQEVQQKMQQNKSRSVKQPEKDW
ncbi:MAG: VWA domain-containing protein [Chitinophagaceae bacterium]|nr:VWA domain-containing protein [Chitinophagaceae bacterium]